MNGGLDNRWGALGGGTACELQDEDGDDGMAP